MTQTFQGSSSGGRSSRRSLRCLRSLGLLKTQWTASPGCGTLIQDMLDLSRQRALADRGCRGKSPAALGSKKRSMTFAFCNLSSSWNRPVKPNLMFHPLTGLSAASLHLRHRLLL